MSSRAGHLRGPARNRRRVVGILAMLAAGLLLRASDTFAPSPSTNREAPPVAALSVPERLVPSTETAAPAVFGKQIPESLKDLASMQRHIRMLVKRVSPAVVGVEVGGASGSGVVISADGIVLTAAHVCGRAGRPVKFLFADGRIAHGRTLGADHLSDAGLMKITDPGDWPHVAVAPAPDVRVGEWVLAMGHPGGFDPDRPPVVRLGRVLEIEPEGLQTDCTLTAGDSGGPLFDMEGRVAAIHSRISEAAEDNYHVPVASFFDSWTRLARGETWGNERPPPRPWVGLRGVDQSDGIEVDSLDETGPAFRAGVRVGDRILRVNGKTIATFGEFRGLVAGTRAGDALEMMIQRNSESRTVTVTVESRRRRR